MQSSDYNYSRPNTKISFKVSKNVASLLTKSKPSPNFTYDFMDIKECSSTQSCIQLIGSKAWKLQDWLMRLDEPASKWPYSLFYDQLLKQYHQFECLTYFFAYYYAVSLFNTKDDQDKYAALVSQHFIHHSKTRTGRPYYLASNIREVVLALKKIETGQKNSVSSPLKCGKFGLLPAEIKEFIFQQLYQIEVKVQSDWAKLANSLHDLRVYDFKLPVNYKAPPVSILLPLRLTNRCIKSHVDSFIERHSLEKKNNR